MHRLLVAALLLVGVFGLLPGISQVSLIIEMGLLALVALLTVVARGNAAGIGVIPVINRHTDVAIILFVIVWGIGSTLHGSYGVPNLLALLRYMVLAYFVAKFFDAEDVLWISKFVVFLGLSQIVIGAFQVFGLLPWVMAEVPLEKSGLYGVFKDNISYAAILLCSMVVYGEIFRKKLHFRDLAFFALFLIFLFLSGSRGFFILGLAYFTLGVLKLRWWSAGILAIAGLVILVDSGIDFGTANEDFLFFLSDSYVQVALSQRFGLVIEVLPQFLFSPDVFLGLGSDRDFVVNHIAAKYDLFYMSGDYLVYIIEDVYWAAMFIYYGAVGLFFFLLYLFGLYRASFCFNKPGFGMPGIVKVFRWLLLFALFLGFIGQVFEIKVFSLIFWIFVGSMVVGRHSEVGIFDRYVKRNETVPA